MQTIGERLEEARKRKGISIREAAETTKIRSDYLQKFEANSFDVDLPPLYLKGFLRSYARFLELDPEHLLSEFNALLAEGKPVRRESREVYGRVDFADASRATEAGAVTPPSRSAQDQALLIKFLLLGGGAIVGVVVLIILCKVLFFSTPARSVAPAAQPPVTAQAEGTQTLTLTATDATRVKVVQDLDGAILFNGALAQGETKSLKKQGRLLITVEDRTKLRMEVNGRLTDIPVFPANQGNYGKFRLD